MSITVVDFTIERGNFSRTSFRFICFSTFKENIIWSLLACGAHTETQSEKQGVDIDLVKIQVLSNSG